MPDTRQLRRRHIVHVKDPQMCLKCIHAHAILNYAEFTGLHEDILFCDEHFWLYPFDTNWPDGCEYYKEVMDNE